MRLQQGDLVPGNVGGTDTPGNSEDAQKPSRKDLKANALSREYLPTCIPMNAWDNTCQRDKACTKKARRTLNKLAKQKLRSWNPATLPLWTTW
eukprot:2778663-Heterocapsa_arctica.AAC.1